MHNPDEGNGIKKFFASQFAIRDIYFFAFDYLIILSFF